jgi:predicted PhzF superfamily epimerase YddE/YHI9
MKTAIVEARVFIGEGAAGNVARCYVLDRPLSRTACSRLSSQFPRATCFCWWQRGALSVRCFQHGKVVKFCGHGILASAYAWWSLNRRSGTRGHGFSLRSGRRHLRFFERHGAGWLCTAPINCVKQILPPSVAAQCQPQPIAMALAGGASGYKIFEWPAGTDIATVTIEKSLLLSDGRATILTAASTDYDFVLRYLAPQYGIDEDGATGSANVVLADYWQQRGLVPPYRAKQCSSTGGVILSDIRLSDIRVSDITSADSCNPGMSSQRHCRELNHRELNRKQVAIGGQVIIEAISDERSFKCQSDHDC